MESLYATLDVFVGVGVDVSDAMQEEQGAELVYEVFVSVALEVEMESGLFGSRGDKGDDCLMGEQTGE